MTIGEWAGRLRYRYVPDHLVGEVLGRRWVDNVIPVGLLIALTLYLGDRDSEFRLGRKHQRHARQIGEFGLIVIGMTIVMLAGGIDLSVGSNFALANVTALALINVAQWPVGAAIAATIGVGALVGLINGFLIGYLRLRAFLTTLVDPDPHPGGRRPSACRFIRSGSRRVTSSSPFWDFVGSGSVLGAPFSFVILIVIASSPTSC